jgi:hypothetical protein
MTTDKRKSFAITRAIIEKLHEKKYDEDREIRLLAIEKREEIEREFKVELFIEPHAISAWTKRTPIKTWYL